MSIPRRTRPGSEVAYALLARGAQGVTAVLASVGVVWQFSLDQQALFFVFISLGALIQWGDFGLTYAVLQTAGDVARAGRLSAFQRQARRIGQVLLLTVSISIGVLGTLLMARQVPGLWFGPWFAFSVAAAAAQYMQLELAFVEGARSVSLAWRVRFAQELLGGAAFIAALVAGAGLWSLCVYWGLRAAVAAGWLGLSGAWMSPADPPHEPFSWRVQVWPFQWRIGLSGLSGFLIFQAFNPILLVEQGSAAAATFGMSLAVMNMLLLVATAWPMSQAARYGRWLSQGQHALLRQRFRRMLFGSTTLVGFSAAAGLAVLAWMHHQQLPVASRFADLPTTAVLLGAALIHHANGCYGVLLRAERREPLLAVTLFGGLFGILAVWLAARHGSPRDIALTHLACTLIGLLIVRQHYKRFNARHAAATVLIAAGPPAQTADTS